MSAAATRHPPERDARAADPGAPNPGAAGSADDITPTDSSACSIERSLAIIGDRWSMLVLRDAFRGIRRFDELRRDLDIARPVLADRLKRLVDAGVLERRLYQERPPRYEYRLTVMGVELSPILVALMRWGDKYLSGENGPPTVLVHEPCGHELRQGFFCASCAQTFAPSAIRSRPGPGSTSPRPNHNDDRRPAGLPAASSASHVQSQSARSQP